jgi:hypothetical protein
MASVVKGDTKSVLSTRPFLSYKYWKYYSLIVTSRSCCDIVLLIQFADDDDGGSSPWLGKLRLLQSMDGRPQRQLVQGARLKTSTQATNCYMFDIPGRYGLRGSVMINIETSKCSMREEREARFKNQSSSRRLYWPSLRSTIPLKPRFTVSEGTMAQHPHKT